MYHPFRLSLRRRLKSPDCSHGSFGLGVAWLLLAAPGYSQGQGSQEQAPQEQAPQGQASQGQAPQGQASQGLASQGHGDSSNAHSAHRAPPESDPEVHPVRALLELQAVFLLGVVYYGATGSSDSGFSVNYDWDVFRRKISGQSFASDRNHFATNFIGHPLGGGGYYLSARSNGMGVLASSAISVTGSLVWELFGEPKEEISMNDTIVTPMAGIAIGETTFRVAGLLNRSEATWFNRTIGAILDPFSAVNQRVDGTEPQRVATGFPTDGWHQAFASLGMFQVYERSARRFEPVPEFALSAHVRTEESALPTRTAPLRVDTFSNGHAAHLGLEVARTPNGLSRLEVELESVLAGINYTAARSADDAETGYLGLGMGFTYTARGYRRAEHTPLNLWSSTRPAHVATGHHVKRGNWELDAWAAVGPNFAGVEPLQLQGAYQQAPFPDVMRLHGYYFGWGVFSNAQIRLRNDVASFAFSFLNETVQSTRAPGEPALPSMRDAHQYGSVAVGYRIPSTTTQLQLFGARRLRQSRVVNTSSSHEELTSGLQLITQTN